MALGDNIYKLRKENKLSQENLAEKISVTRQTISNWELNITQPNPEQLKLLSINLNVSIDYLLDNCEKQSNEAQAILDSEPILITEDNKLNGKKIFIIIISILSFIVLCLTILLIVVLVNNKDNSNSSVESIEYSVVYDSQNGDELKALLVDNGSYLYMPTDTPVKDGYKFEGWYYNNELWDFTNNKVTSNIVLVAKYSKNKEEIILDKDNLEHYLSKFTDNGSNPNSYEYRHIDQSSFLLLGDSMISQGHTLGDYRVTLKTIYEGKNNISAIGVEVSKSCSIEFSIATESKYGYAATLTEIKLTNDNGEYGFTKLDNVGQSTSSANITNVTYNYTGNNPTTLFFATFDRSIAIFNVKIKYN